MEIQKEEQLLLKNQTSKSNEKNQKDKIIETVDFDKLLQVKYGDIGTKKRDEFESKAQ